VPEVRRDGSKNRRDQITHQADQKLMLRPCSGDPADTTVTKELWGTTVNWLPCGVTILKLSTLTFIGVVGLLPTQASAQFNLPILIPPFYLRSPSYHYSAPSHHSSSHAKHEDNNGSSTEKDATQEESNTGPSAEHQQQVSGPTGDVASSPPRSTPSQNKPDARPLFVPSR
jgi:hypothetical protein